MKNQSALVDGEADEFLAEAGLFLELEGGAAEEVDGRFQFARETEAGLERIVVEAQVGVPVPVALVSETKKNPRNPSQTRKMWPKSKSKLDNVPRTCAPFRC